MRLQRAVAALLQPDESLLCCTRCAPSSGSPDLKADGPDQPELVALEPMYALTPDITQGSGLRQKMAAATTDSRLLVLEVNLATGTDWRVLRTFGLDYVVGIRPDTTKLVSWRAAQLEIVFADLSVLLLGFSAVHVPAARQFAQSLASVTSVITTTGGLI